MTVFCAKNNTAPVPLLLVSYVTNIYWSLGILWLITIKHWHDKTIFFISLNASCPFPSPTLGTLAPLHFVVKRSQSCYVFSKLRCKVGYVTYKSKKMSSLWSLTSELTILLWPHFLGLASMPLIEIMFLEIVILCRIGLSFLVNSTLNVCTVPSVGLYVP